LQTNFAICIHNLKKKYSNGVQALDGVDLEVTKGDFFALLGPNGAGKSTIIGILSSLVTKSSGQVEICGFNMDTDKEKAKTHLGVVPQEFNFGIFEEVINIVINQAGYYGIPSSEARERGLYYLDKLGLFDKRHSPAGKLSGGMKRRLMISRAMVHDPEVLILDEPTAGVDIEIRRSMWEFLTELNQKGKTIILTTHYLEEAESLCKNIAIINHGKIIENTSMKELLSKLNRETFVFDLKLSQEMIPMEGDIEFRWIDNQTIEASLSKEQTLNQVFQHLEKKNIQISSMRNKSNRLEELFLNLVEKK
jgi:ABC-2 type transport system ATP-binding protein